ncbi:MAG: type II toxin-antitoxin system death-on-curing family toxin [Pyrinomonadaceae bacterium]
MITSAEHGIRDKDAFEAALMATENRFYYENADISILATYAYHLSQAHAFLDGNKRIAAAVAGIFLRMNKAKLSATNEQIIEIFLDIAAGRLSREDVEKKFGEWIAESKD